jgi:Skp family chaperone for outer membrane proteins
MQSFRQSNPFDNINELKENIELTRERLLELDKRLYDQIPIMLEIPPIRQLTILNLELILKYFNLQITLNEFLNTKIGDIALTSYYFKFIIDLNNRYQFKIEKMIDILKNEKKEQYSEIIDLIKMYSLPFYFYVLGMNMPKLTAKDICISLTKDIDNITLDPEKIKESLKSMSEKIQSQINDMQDNVSNVVGEIKIPKKENNDDDSEEKKGSVKSKSTSTKKKLRSDNKYSNSRNTLFNKNNTTQLFNGGNKKNIYNSIYDPINNKWVDTKSNRGKILVNTYVSNLINNY